MASAFGVLKINFLFTVGFILTLLVPVFLYSQSVKELVVGKSGITTILKQYPDSIIEDVQRNTMLFLVEDSVKTFWYKIYLNIDCDISFDIYPSGLGNNYNYILYAVTGANTPREVSSENDGPIRKNLYMDAMYITGIGLSRSSVAGSGNYAVSDSVKYLYHTTYHEAEAAKKGEVLLLRVFHVKGSDCGHYLTLKANNSFRKFQVVHKSCYNEMVKTSQFRYYSYQSPDNKEIPEDDSIKIAAQTAVLKRTQSILFDVTESPVILSVIHMVPASIPISGSISNSTSNHPSNHFANQISDNKTLLVEHEIEKQAQFQLDKKKKKAELTVIYEPNALFIIKDSLKKMFIDAEVNMMKPKNSGIKIMVGQKGEYGLVLENNTNYHFVFSSLGYKSRDIFFNSGDSMEAFESEIFLTPCKEGENFIMNNIYFYPNTSEMKKEGRAELEKLAQFLNYNPKISIEIQGHTSGNKRIRASYHGSFKGSSKKLSQCRAEFIKKYLTEKGIDRERLKAVGYGGTNMIYKKPKNQSQANKNIRVEILLLTSKQTLSYAKNR